MGIYLKNILAVLPEGGDALKNAKDRVVRTDIYFDETIKGIGAKPEGFVVDKEINGGRFLVIPGLVNCHTHSYMAFMRNAADDLSFMDWLFGTIDPLEQKMTDEDAYWGACLAIIEMLRSGTTCFNDMHMNIHRTSKAVRETGIRACLSRGLVGNGNDEAGSSRLKQAFEEMEANKDYDRLTFRLAPHAPYTCDAEFMRIVSDEAKKRNLGIHVHLSESESEISGVKEKYDCTPIEMAERNGLFDVPCVAAHCVQIDDTDIEILKKHNVSVVTNPASNMKLGNGFAPVAKLLEAGVNVCLGTDGAASNNSLNMFRELGLLTLIHKGTAKTPQCVSAQEGFRAATINGAKALGLEKEIGSIEVGKKADLVLMNLDSPSLTPANNLIAALAYSANGSEVETVFVNGETVVENGHLTKLSEKLVYSKINDIITRMELDKKEY